jgi:hypothetical protein
MPSNDEVARFLRAKLDEAERNLAEKQAELEPMLDEVRRLRASLRDYTAGAMGSAQMTDEVIVNWIRAHGSEAEPVSAREVAAGLEVDTRGISNRLPRMVKHRLIFGSPKQGYWAGPRVPRQRARRGG